MLNKVVKQTKLSRTAVNLLFAPKNAMRASVDTKIAERRLAVGERRANAPKHGAQSGGKLVRGKRLGDVVISAGIKTADPIRLF